MDFWSVFFFSLFLLICAAGLMASHVRTWRRFQQRREQLNPREFDYRRRQFRRRMQSTAMLAILAVALLAGHWITAQHVRPLVFSVYWGSVLLVVLWVGLLAVVDMIATKHYFARLRQDCVIEEAKLQAELRRIVAGRGNGKLRPDLGKERQDAGGGDGQEC